MCFSAEASFGVGGILVPMGGYCLWSAIRKSPRFLGLAVVPLAFGLQQISEGFVWLAFNDNNPEQARLPALFFLFFALAFWPFWFPLLAAVMETQTRRKWILGALCALALVWFWVLYFPLLSWPESYLQINVEHHSIQYQYPALPIYLYVDKPWLRLLYFLTLAAPQAVSSERWGRVPGLILLASAAVSIVLFEYAFVSVWCFFAAVLATYCCVVFYRLPPR